MSVNQRENLETASSEAGTWFSSRYCLCYLAIVGFVNMYSLRFNLSVAILSMVNNTADDNSNGSCPQHNNTTNHNNNNGNGEFDWTESQQGLILSAFFYGYIITQIPGGYLAGRFGGKLVFGVGILCTSVLALLTPIAAKAHKDGSVLIALRVLQGLAEGVTFPAMHAMWGKWAPPVERTFLVSMSNAGAQLGTVISLPISGLLCDSAGWESVFYFFGALGIAWFPAWFLFAHNSPEDHPKISDAERTYITSNITRVDESSTPWREILSSKPAWAISIAHFCNNWGYYILLITIPTYLNATFHFSSTKSGIFSALPAAFMWIMINVVGFVADTLRRRSLLTTTHTRKLFNSIGFAGPAVFLILAGFAGKLCNGTAAVAMICIAYSINAFMYAGYYSNHIDISSRYAGLLMGISNTWATIPGCVAPVVVKALTHQHSIHQQWMIVFYITAGVYAAGAVAYLLLASGDEQEWNKPGFQRRGLRDDDVTSPHAPLMPHIVDDIDD